MLERPHSVRRAAATLLVLVLQLLFTGLVPVADARATAADPGTRMGVHVEKPGVHHAVHDPADCVFCIALQLGAAPATPGRAPKASVVLRVSALAERDRSCPALPLTSPVARAPPTA